MWLTYEGEEANGEKEDDSGEQGQLPPPEGVGLQFKLPSGQTTIGWLTAALQRIFSAAFKSAFPSNPHLRHLNTDWLTPVPVSTYPHLEHRLLVSRGSTINTGTPASFALYSTKALS